MRKFFRLLFGHRESKPTRRVYKTSGSCHADEHVLYEVEPTPHPNGGKPFAHDLMHIMKSLGRVAAECERADHGVPRRLQKDELAKEVADFVICALRIANLEGFDLHDAVVNAIESRNSVQYLPENL